MAELVLYGHPDSGHACKVALALSIAGLPHRTIWIDIWAAPATRPADFLAASPFAEVPLLLIDGEPYIQCIRPVEARCQEFSACQIHGMSSSMRLIL